MRLLVDDRWFGQTGIGRYAQEVLSRFPLEEDQLLRLGRKWPIKHPLTPFYLARAIKQKQPDVFWSPGFIPPAMSKVPFIFTIHDLIHLHFASKVHIAYYNFVIRPLSKQAFKILTDSEYSRQEILEWANISQDQVLAVPIGVDGKFRPNCPKHNIGEPYVIYIGNRKRHKNIERLLRAFAASGLAKKIRLAISGRPDAKIIGLASKLNIYERLTFLGFIQEEYLPAIYRGALALIYVSLYEGFGLPPLEAMACGTPVLTSNLTSLPEVVGDAGMMVNPYDVDAIARGLQSIVEDSDLREDLRRKGLERVKVFTWERTAELTWQVISEAAMI